MVGNNKACTPRKEPIYWSSVKPILLNRSIESALIKPVPAEYILVTGRIRRRQQFKFVFFLDSSFKLVFWLDTTLS
jgi:hypothetical protein